MMGGRAEISRRSEQLIAKGISKRGVWGGEIVWCLDERGEKNTVANFRLSQPKEIATKGGGRKKSCRDENS